jgi:hypothetical protein
VTQPKDGDGPRDGDQNGRGRTGGDPPDMTRERARTERRDLDKERGKPVAGAAIRGHGRPRALRAIAKPLGDWTSRPRILITNDDGVESRGLLALKQALDPIGDTTVIAPDTNQSAVGHQKTLMRPLRVRERTLADGSMAYSVDGSPTDAVSIAFLGYFGHGFDLVAASGAAEDVNLDADGKALYEALQQLSPQNDSQRALKGQALGKQKKKFFLAAAGPRAAKRSVKKDQPKTVR